MRVGGWTMRAGRQHGNTRVAAQEVDERPSGTDHG